MKTRIGRNGRSWKPAVAFARAFIVAGCLFGAASGLAQMPPPDDGGPTNTPLDSWSFQDQTNWTSDLGHSPVSFSNLGFTNLGDGASLVVDSSNPAWLQYNVYENDGTTNLTVGAGSLTFWYAPGWSSADTNAGGTGPGDWAQLINVGEWTTNSSYGYWGLSLDPGGTNIYFVTQDGLGDTYVMSSPVSWTTNYFHFVALTYSATNVSLYLDGQLATNDANGLSIWPGSNALAGGIYFGSDTNGMMIAHGLFNIVATYDYPLDSNDIAQIYTWEHGLYVISPFNIPYMDINQAPANPSEAPATYDIITGSGNLQFISSGSVISSSNVWITNVVVTTTGSGTNQTMNLQFTIQGGWDYLPYDTFVNSILDFSSDTNKAWAWEGQGYHGNTYEITNLPSTTCFLILGTPQDSDFDGLTDAYERLVSKTNPYNADTSGDGISDSDEILNGDNPLSYNPGWQLDTDSDGLPDTYETTVGWNPNLAEAAPGLPAYSENPIQ